MVANIIIAIIAYLIGSISFSIIFGKKFAGIDVRERGSGNAGTTNVLRTVGKGPAALTLICDIAKGLLAVVIAYIVGKIFGDKVNAALLVQIAGIFVILGHTFPVFFGFKGGKGIATAAGILLISNYQIGLICLVFWAIIVLLTKTVSIGSMGAAILFPVLTLFINQNYLVPGNYVIFGIVIALIVAFNHRANIQRIMEGTENKLSFGKK